MPNSGLFLAVCTLFLAADGLARPVADAAPAPQPECRFTLERGVQSAAADDADETWVLTCHRGEAPQSPVTHAVSLRRVPVPKLPTTD
jgi:hypothetical protein